ncbi:hypothetical protein [Variovorax sp. W6]|uniref:hypothetical protein n=1 Tax=Variovorax sp. W6 TaxID=3093895 RepID=UPI003D80254E
MKLEVFWDAVPGLAGGDALAGDPPDADPSVDEPPVPASGNVPAPEPPPPHPGSATAIPVTEPASISFSNSRRLFSGTEAN